MVLTIVNIIILAIFAVSNFFLYRYQSKKLDAMDRLLKQQSDFINSFDQYRKLLDIDDFNKKLQFKLDHQKDELLKDFSIQLEKTAIDASKESIDYTIQSILAQYGKFNEGYEELTNIAINITMKNYPNKIDRDKHINTHYPKNAEAFITFCDAIEQGKVKPKS